MLLSTQNVKQKFPWGFLNASCCVVINMPDFQENPIIHKSSRKDLFLIIKKSVRILYLFAGKGPTSLPTTKPYISVNYFGIKYIGTQSNLAILVSFSN